MAQFASEVRVSLMTINFFSILLIATVSVGCLLILALLTSRQKNKTANYLLCSLIVLFSFYALIKILSNTQDITDFPFLIRTYRPVFVLACANFYFYCIALTMPDFKFKIQNLYHLVPVSIYSLLTLPFYFSSNAEKIASLSQQPFTLSWSIERGFFVLIFAVYFSLSYRVVSRYQASIKEQFSNTDKIKLDWLKKLTILFAVIWIVALFRFLSAYGKVGYENKFMVPILLCATIFLIAWRALKQPEIFSDRWNEQGSFRHQERNKLQNNFVEPVKESSVKPSPAKYESSSLSESEIEQYKLNLVEYLEQEKPYIDPDLKLQHLADHLGVHSHQLSQIINTHLQKNFYDLINSLRINEAKQRLIDPKNQQMNIVTVAFDVGFNSKSTFNSAFKKYTNMTPTQFKKSHSIQA